MKYIRFPDRAGKELFFAEYGKFVHALLADFYAGRKTGQEAELSYLLDFRSRVRPAAPSGKIFSSYFLDGLNYLQTIKPPAGEVLAVEREVRFSAGGVPFLGYIDLVDRDAAGDIAIIDHKSRKLKPRSGRAAPTNADMELDGYLRQLYLYAIPVRELYGQFPAKLCFNCFRDGLLIEEPFRAEQLSSTVQWAAAQVEAIAAETDFRPEVEYFKCRYLCEMQDVCEYYELSRR